MWYAISLLLPKKFIYMKNRVMAMILSEKTRVWFTIATFVVIVLAILWFWMKLWVFQSDMAYMKIEIAKSNEKIDLVSENQVTMSDVRVAIYEALEKKK